MKKIAVIFFMVVLVIFCLSWPTRYHYEKSKSDIIRINVWTGQATRLGSCMPTDGIDFTPITPFDPSKPSTPAKAPYYCWVDLP